MVLEPLAGFPDAGRVYEHGLVARVAPSSPIKKPEHARDTSFWPAKTQARRPYRVLSTRHMGPAIDDGQDGPSLHA